MEREHLEDLSVDGIVCPSRSGMQSHGLDSSGSGNGEAASYCECGKELRGSIKCGKFLL